MWTCIRCKSKFNPITRSRICASCAPRSCKLCGRDVQTKRADMVVCDSCKPNKAAARATEWYVENKDRKRAYDAKRREEKRHLYREASKRHRESNPAKKKADVIARRAGIKKQTPSWANIGYMNLFYKIAKLEQTRIGKPVHVDHIYPLNSKWVCGLHCEQNMQLLIAAENIAKSNHYSIEHGGIK